MNGITEEQQKAYIRRNNSRFAPGDAGYDRSLIGLGYYASKDRRRTTWVQRQTLARSDVRVVPAAPT
jgi:hypothetical protein